jgi:mRNA interferase MazF
MNFGDIVMVDFGQPVGSEAGFVRPAIVMTADGFLRYRPSTVFAIPLTSTRRAFPSHIELSADATNLLGSTSYALVEQMRAVATERCTPAKGNVGPLVAHQLLEILAMIIGMP